MDPRHGAPLHAAGRRNRSRTERLFGAARSAVLFVGGSGVLVGVWALSERQTAFWPGWVIIVWGSAVTLHAWVALRPADRRRSRA